MLSFLKWNPNVKGHEGRGMSWKHKAIVGMEGSETELSSWSE